MKQLTQKTVERVTCARCKKSIPVRPGINVVDSVLIHYVEDHAAILDAVDKRQFHYQS